jgi:leucine dehydrogenase
MQGVGHVGQNLCKLLTDAGANILVADINQKNLDYVVDTYGCKPMDEKDILTAECDILAPCALGGSVDGSVVQNLRCSILCGGANNILDDPEEDAVALKTAGILYAPDFVVNAGGLIHLAGMYLGLSDETLQTKNDEIFDTTEQVLQLGENTASTFAAAFEIAEQRISGGRETEVHAG